MALSKLAVTEPKKSSRNHLVWGSVLCKSLSAKAVIDARQNIGMTHSTLLHVYNVTQQHDACLSKLLESWLLV